jgi:hypothetical protein
VYVPIPLTRAEASFCRILKDETTYTVPITLIALHHGELPLPKVAVEALHIGESEPIMERMAAPTTETYQMHGAETVTILPRGGRTTFVVGMGAG